MFVKFVPVTGITKAIVITGVFHGDMETITDLGDQWIHHILNNIETKEGTFKKVDCFQAEAYSELW